MSIDDSVIKALQDHPQLHTNLNNYAVTGLETYAKMIEFDLKIIKQNYGNDIFGKFNHIYMGIREIYDTKTER